MKDETGYICDSCGEEIALPIDLLAGPAQRYVYDCTVLSPKRHSRRV
jgi:hypothetical protein